MNLLQHHSQTMRRLVSDRVEDIHQGDHIKSLHLITRSEAAYSTLSELVRIIAQRFQ